VKRKIGDALYYEFDGRLALIAQAQNCIYQRNARGLLIEAARCMIDLVEYEDVPHQHDLIDPMHEVAGSSPGDSWCMGFVQSCIAYVERRLKIASPIHRDGNCVAVWDGTDATQRVSAIPLGGAIAIWQSVDDPTHGHAAIVRDCDGAIMNTIEGNTMPQSDAAGIVEADGGGVFPCLRAWDLATPNASGLILRGALKPF
jgi:hypothetical protein